MRIIFMLFLLIVTKPCWACICDEKITLNLKEASSYDVIFYGKVLGSSACKEGNSIVKFKVIELYKGHIGQVCKMSFLCGKEDCSGDFQNEAEWLIFTNLNNAQELVFDLCSYSRELLTEIHGDYVDQERGSTFFQDHEFLRSNFALKTQFKNELKARRYEKVDPILIPIFLGVSLLFMIVGIYIFKRTVKKSK